MYGQNAGAADVKAALAHAAREQRCDRRAFAPALLVLFCRHTTAIVVAHSDADAIRLKPDPTRILLQPDF